MKLNNYKYYIVLEGLVGCGKSTQVNMLFDWLIKEFPEKKIFKTFEPGGSEIANNIRKVVQGTKFKEEMDPVCEAYLYASSRAQTLRNIVKPALERGEIVIADRSVFTSVSFQGFGRGMGAEKVISINKDALGEIWPGLVLVIDVNPKTALSRTVDKDGDKFESMGEDFFAKCRKGFHWIVINYSFVKLINGEGTPAEVHMRIIKEVKKYLSS